MSSTRKILATWLISRILLFTVAALAASRGTHYPGYLQSSLGPVCDAWNKGDAHFYAEIATTGYQPGYLSNCGWCPGFALLLKCFWITPWILLNSIILANLLLLAGLLMTWKLLRLDQSEGEAWRGLLLLLAFPSAYFLAAPLSESAFLLFSVGAFWAARRKRWALAGVLGGAASSTRVMGLLLWPALLLEKPGKKAAWLALIPIGQLLFCWHLQQKVGDFWAYYHMQRRLEPHISGWARLAQGRALDGQHWIGITFAAVSLTMLALAWRRLRPSERLYCLCSLLLPLYHSLWVSTGRLMVVLTPLFAGTAPQLPKALFPGILSILVCLQLIGLWFYSLGNPYLIY